MFKTKIITKKKRIVVSLQDSTRFLEVASRRAIQLANSEFGIDENGHSHRVKLWERSCCSVRLQFETMEISGGMCGWEYTAIFKAWCEKHEDEDDEDDDLSLQPV